MAKLEYVPTKRGINENGNKAWTYKNAEAFEHVFGYILTPERGIIFASALGLPFLSVSDMAESFCFTQNLYHKNSGRLIRHEVLTFENDRECYDVNGQNRIDEIAYYCACTYALLGFQAVYAVWKHDLNMQRMLPEIHFAVNTVSLIDGHKYQTNREKLQEQENQFNELIQRITQQNMAPVIKLKDEPDYSDQIYLPIDIL